MIVAERKPFDEIAAATSGFRKVLVAACGTCVAVCLTGGEKEAGILAAQLDMAATLGDREQVFSVGCVERQCDREFLEELGPQIAEADAVISMACGAGIQFLAEAYPDTPVLSGVNTTFIGVNEDVGVWTERCRSCRDCVLSITGGVCPIALCPKGMLNGPCGGAEKGKCETDRERDCAWSVIYRRLENTGRLANLEEVIEARDHRDLLPGRQVHPAYQRRYSAHE